MKKITLFIILITLFFSCKAYQSSTSVKETSTLVEDQNLNAVLWMQTSAEYEMLCHEVYTNAEQSIDEALKDSTITAALEQKNDYKNLPPAIIVDVDETILDNSPFQASLSKAHLPYSDKLWKTWVNKKTAKPMPGAKKFINDVLSKGVTVFFVTNRELETPTLENLQKEFNPSIKADVILCKNEQSDWTSNKTSRRTLIAKTHRIILLLGDDYNDFVYLGNLSPKERKQKASLYSNMWGKQWFILPNPSYGSFERALWNYDYQQNNNQKLKKKYKHLKPMH